MDGPMPMEDPWSGLLFMTRPEPFFDVPVAVVINQTREAMDWPRRDDMPSDAHILALLWTDTLDLGESKRIYSYVNRVLLCMEFLHDHLEELAEEGHVTVQEDGMLSPSIELMEVLRWQRADIPAGEEDPDPISYGRIQELMEIETGLAPGQTLEPAIRVGFDAPCICGSGLEIISCCGGGMN